MTTIKKLYSYFQINEFPYFIRTLIYERELEIFYRVDVNFQFRNDSTAVVYVSKVIKYVFC